MAIHPRFAEAILSGRKRVEFRKRSLARDVSDVLIYATSPIQRVVGRFNVSDIVCGSPNSLWEDYGNIADISRTEYLRYYRGCALAYGLLVGRVERFAVHLTLADLDPCPAVPQSFSYLAASAAPVGGAD